MGTELKMKPVGDKSIKLQKINKQVSKRLVRVTLCRAGLRRCLG
jgi:hypothetical protein